MTQKRFLIAVGVFIVAVASSGAAQGGSTRPVQLVVTGGAAVPTGGFSDYHDLGIQANVGLLINAFGKSLRLRPEFAYSRFKLKEELESQLQITSYASVRSASRAASAYGSEEVSKMLGGFANIEIPLGPAGFQPFILGGVGLVDVETPDATASGEQVKFNMVSFNAGAGIRFKLGGIGGIIEARFNDVPSKDTKAYFKSIQIIPITFGLVF